MALVGIKWGVSAVALLLFSFLFGKRIRFDGVVPILIMACVVAPAYIFVAPLIDLLHVPSPDSPVTVMTIRSARSRSLSLRARRSTMRFP